MQRRKNILIGDYSFIGVQTPLSYEMASHYLRLVKNNMDKAKIAIIIYVSGLIFGAVVLDMWSAETSPKALLGMAWTALFLIALYFAEFKDK